MPRNNMYPLRIKSCVPSQKKKEKRKREKWLPLKVTRFFIYILADRDT